MLPIETDILIAGHSTSYMVDQLIDNECFCTNNNPNSQPMTSNDFANKTISGLKAAATVNKSYELSDNIVHESYFDTNGMDDANEFINDYANSYPNGVILVLNETGLNSEIKFWAAQLNSQLKHIVVCNNKSENLEVKNKQTLTESLKEAANTAYKMATNGQAILFQGVSANFDLFSHIY